MSLAMPTENTDLSNSPAQAAASQPGDIAQAGDIVQLVSPSNKARPAARRAFAMKCLNYLNAGIGLVVVDVVTDRRANLHDEMVGLVVGNAPGFPGTPSSYAAAYRPYRRGGTFDNCRAELARCSGSQFDPRCVEAFLSMDEATLLALAKPRRS